MKKSMQFTGISRTLESQRAKATMGNSFYHYFVCLVIILILKYLWFKNNFLSISDTGFRIIFSCCGSWKKKKKEMV